MPDPAAGKSLDDQLRIGVGRLREHLLNHADMIFRRMLDQAPDDAAALRYLGITLCKLGRPEDGIARLRAATELAPALAGGWSDLAVALRRAGDPKGAAEAYAHAAGQPAPVPVPADLLRKGSLADVNLYGASFWMRKTGSGEA